MSAKDIEKNFTYHKPSEDKQSRYVEIRNTAKQMAYVIDNACPESREKSLAFTKLEEVVMWANAAVARNDLE